jgi:hypothetical protein
MGIQATSTAADWMRSRKTVIRSMRDKRAGVMVNLGS